ncbi:hypothetical protein LTR27_000844 [Elasticomyces elasticus]|nr:hypothetical protein LTR27_000844 [Elasticomyces elasticus]
MAIEQKLRKLRPGLYGPLPTFFDDDQELDLVSYRKHLLSETSAPDVPLHLLTRPQIWQPKASVTRPLRYLVDRSISNLDHLSTVQNPTERTALIRFIRQTLDDAGLSATPIVAGVGGLSTRETIRLAQDAAEAGALVNHILLE